MYILAELAGVVAEIVLAYIYFKLSMIFFVGWCLVLFYGGSHREKPSKYGLFQ